MENLTLETLPKAFIHLTNEVSEIKRLLLEKSNEPPIETDRWFDLNELCSYLPDKPSKATVYGWVHFGLIPCHKGQKKLRFLKSEIDTWLKKGRKKTSAETANEAEQYLTTKKAEQWKITN
jgi:predicted DNA-binding transcriptional regulator AlpA